MARKTQQPLVRRVFGDLSIHVLATETPWDGDNKLALYIHGKRRYIGEPATLRVLFCLLEQPSCVYGFAHLCSALGLKKQTLVEHVRRGRILLQQSRLPLHIALVPSVGYALCRKARSRIGVSTRRA